MTTREQFSIQIHKDGKRAHAKIEGVVPKDMIGAVRNGVIQKIGENKKIDGFREGNAPSEIVEREVGSLEIWRQSAQEVITKHFAEIVAGEEVVPLGQPQLQITNIADKNDVSFQIQFYMLPKVTLPDYKVLLQKLEKPEEPKGATDEEVQRVLLDVRKGLYKKAHPEKDVPKDEGDLPELTDTYVQEVSQQHKDVENFKKGIQESITQEKALQARALFRQKILDTIAENTAVTIPEIMIEEESKRAYEEMKGHAEHFKTTIEEYLKAQNMSEGKLWEQLREDARKRAKIQLIMNTVSTQENIRADIDEIEKEVARFKKKQTDMTDEQIHTYITSLLTNEAVVQSLEKIAVEGKE
ncbi:MAG: trigger factor [Candidatus Kaiserbacteria bacterium]|nr:trigger factor [Candidatus Kaiserbacteria bacterium]